MHLTAVIGWLQDLVRAGYCCAPSKDCDTELMQPTQSQQQLYIYVDVWFNGWHRGDLLQNLQLFALFSARVDKRMCKPEGMSCSSVAALSSCFYTRNARFSFVRV